MSEDFTHYDPLRLVVELFPEESHTSKIKTLTLVQVQDRGNGDSRNLEHPCVREEESSLGIENPGQEDDTNMVENTCQRSEYSEKEDDTNGVFEDSEGWSICFFSNSETESDLPISIDPIAVAEVQDTLRL